ncbi:MAG: hypothetical protein ACI8ZM_000159 [Crocinitomix sp.]|jgi:hypothetical protein
MKLLTLILVLFTLSFSGFSQYNDTIFYKSGMEKVVSISDFTDVQIFYSIVNSKGKTKESQIYMNVVSRFVMYDEDGVLQYDSKLIDDVYEDFKKQSKYPSTVSVSKHQLSVNPFVLPFLSASVKYNYRFGKKMQYSICSRATYLGPIFDGLGDNGNLFIGVGFQYCPFYNDRFAFGLDFTPTIIDYTYADGRPTLMFPISVDFDFYFSKNIGISADFGAGNVYDGSSFFAVRAHLGVLFQFNNKKSFETNY